MKKVLLISLRAKGFKGFKEEIFVNFENGFNPFVADNGQGKSSVGEAIAWVLTGRNIFGGHRNLNVKNKDSQEAEVELVFEDENGKQHNLKRRLTKSTTILHNNKEISASELNELIPQELFLMIFNPIYFSQLDAPTQKKLITSYLPTIDANMVLAQMTQNEQDFLSKEQFQADDTATYLKNRKEELDVIKERQVEAKGKLSILSTSIAIPPLQSFHEQILDDKKMALEDAIKKMSQLGNNSDLDKTIAALEAQLKVLKEQTYPNQSKLDLTAANYYQIEKDLTRIKSETFKKEQNVIKKEMEHVKEMYASKHSNYVTLQTKLNEISQPVNTSCPTCEGSLPQPKIEELKAKQVQEIEKLQVEMNNVSEQMGALIEKGKMLAEENTAFENAQAKAEAEFLENQTKAIKELNERLQQCVKEGKALKEDRALFLTNLEQEVKALEARIASEKESLQNSDMSKVSQDLENDIDVLRKEIAVLEKAKSDTMKNNMYVEALNKQEEKRLEDLKVLEANIETMEAEEAKIREAIFYMKQFNAKRIELLHASLDKHLQDVQIRLKKFNENTGEIKECFEISYKGNPISICSTAENIKAGLEISDMIAALNQIEYPVFVDNAESITNYSSKASQLIEVRVEAGVELHDMKRNRRVQRVVV